MVFIQLVVLLFALNAKQVIIALISSLQPNVRWALFHSRVREAVRSVQKDTFALILPCY